MSVCLYPTDVIIDCSVYLLHDGGGEAGITSLRVVNKTRYLANPHTLFKIFKHFVRIIS